jgi:hypothetical protein
MRLIEGVAAQAHRWLVSMAGDSDKRRRIFDAFAVQWAGCCTKTQNAGDLPRRFQLPVGFEGKAAARKLGRFFTARAGGAVVAPHVSQSLSG